MAWGHEHWIMVDDFYLSQNGSTKIRVQSGHSFPKSDFLMSSRVFDGAWLQGNEKKKKLQMKDDQRERSAMISTKGDGTYLGSFAVRRSPETSPIYYGKTLFFTGAEKKFYDNKSYQSGQQLEIVPQNHVSSLKIGDHLKLQLISGGQAVKATFVISDPQGKYHKIRARKSQDFVATFKITGEGSYLIKSKYQGVGATLTFAVKKRR